MNERSSYMLLTRAVSPVLEMCVDGVTMQFMSGGFTLLPPATQRLIQLNQRGQYIPLGLCKLLFRGQALALCVEHFQIAADAPDVTRASQHALVAKRLG